MTDSKMLLWHVVQMNVAGKHLVIPRLKLVQISYLHVLVVASLFELVRNDLDHLVDLPSQPQQQLVELYCFFSNLDCCECENVLSIHLID